MPTGLYTVLLIVCSRQIVYRREIFHTSQLLLSEIKMSDLQISQSEAPVYDGPLMRRSIAGQVVSPQNETSVYVLPLYMGTRNQTQVNRLLIVSRPLFKIWIT
jgi:hypothetical protein